ncbi:hypothetical protein KAH81_06255, partial [bacterium]|nr:hypothetical protein [bacterium]
MLVFFLWMASCQGPVGGYMVSLTLNGERFEYPQARVYVDKVNVYQHFDGLTGYTILDQSVEEYSHLMFTLVAGEWGMEPVFIMTWLSDVYEVPQIAGRNYAVTSLKLYPGIEKYQGIPNAIDYVASFNTQTCYVVATLAKIELEESWVNGIFNGVYIEQVGDKWWRMEIKDGRFGAGYAFASSGGSASEETLP